MPASPTHTPAPSSDSPHYTGPWGVSPRGEGQTEYAGIPHPHTGFFLRFSPDTGPWEVSPLGEGQTGRGACAPSPVSASNMPASPTPGGRCPGKVVSGRASPHSGTLFRLAPYTGPWGVSPRGEGGMRPLPCLCFQYAGIPHPARAEGSHGDTRGRPYPGRIPRHWTVGGIAPGGGADGEGGMCPLPCLYFQHAGIPHPARAEGSHGDTRGRPYPERIPRHWTVGGIASGGGADGEGGMCPLPCLCFQYAGIPHPRRKMPRESRIRESDPTLRLPLQARPIHWTVGSIAPGGGADGEGACAPSPVSTFNMPASPTPGGRYPGKTVSGRAGPHTSSLFRLAPGGGAEEHP